MPASRHTLTLIGVARLGEADGVGKQIVQHLPNPGLVGDEFHCILGNADVEIEAGAVGPVAHAEHGGVDHAGNLDRRQLQLQRAGIDGGEIEDVVDDGQQRARGGRDVVQILALLAVELAGARAGEQLAEADDVGERRPQLIGHVADEMALEPVGRHQRLVALQQRLLVALGVRDIDEGDERRPVGQRRRRQSR